MDFWMISLLKMLTESSIDKKTLDSCASKNNVATSYENDTQYIFRFLLSSDAVRFQDDLFMDERISSTLESDSEGDSNERARGYGVYHVIIEKDIIEQVNESYEQWDKWERILNANGAMRDYEYGVTRFLGKTFNVIVRDGKWYFQPVTNESVETPIADHNLEKVMNSFMRQSR
jgi:hypothetical protein